MKTTDLIPLILYELSESDKYGFELSKSIEDISNGKIIIKQATLYTILKKLEKSKFISSYWQDSEIGGKRHYYKLTQNGNLQLSTMPSINKIIEKVLEEGDLSTADIDEPARPIVNNEEVKNKPEEKQTAYVSIFDMLPDSHTELDTRPKVEEQPKTTETPKLEEAVIPTSEVFAETKIDTLTETEINTNNAELLRKDYDVKGEQFASNANVTKFTESQPNIAKQDFESVSKLTSRSKEKNIEVVPQKLTVEPINYVDYIDFKKNAKYINAKKLANRMWLRVLCSVTYLAIMLVVCALVVNKLQTSKIYFVFLALSIAVIVFYPLLFGLMYDKFKLKCQNGNFKNDLKKQAIIAISVFLVVMVAIIVINISLGANSINKLFHYKNFANIYAPIILTSFVFADLIFSYLFVSRKIKN